MKFIIFTLCIFSTIHAFAAQEIDGRYIVSSQQEAISTYAKITGESKHIVSLKSAPESYRKLEQVISKYLPRLKIITAQPSLPKPYIILVKGDGDSASIGRPNHNHSKVSSTNIISIHQELLGDESYLTGVMVHEIAHYALKHAELIGEEKIKHVYFANETKCIDCLFNPIQDQSNRKKMKSLYSSMDMLSRVNAEEFKNIPLSPYVTGAAGETLANLYFSLLRYTKSTSNECKVAFSTLETLIRFVSQSTNYAELVFTVKKQDKHYYQNMTSLLLFQSGICLENKEDLFDRLLASYFGINSSMAKKMLTNLQSDDEPLFIEALSILSSNKAIMQKIRELVVITERDILNEMSEFKDIKKLRYLSTEDEADEIAVKVLAKSKRPLAFFHYLLEDSQPEDYQACLDKLDKNIEPNFGFLIDKHHSSCWRLWRSKQTLKDYRSQ